MYKKSVFLILIFGLISIAKLQANSENKKAGTNSNHKVIIGNIYIFGNKITKRYIILRELEFKKGDTLTISNLKRKILVSKQNLLNRSLFNFVNIEYQKNKSSENKINIFISVIERWYIWPIPILAYTDRNFNVWWETKSLAHLDYGINLKIDNFRGRMEKLRLKLQNGYNKSFELKWETPYINKEETWGFGFQAGVTINHETDYALNDYKLLFYGNNIKYVKKNIFSKLFFTYRPKYRKLHRFSLIYNYFNYSDSLLVLNPDFAYGENQFSFLTFRYNFKLDYRDYAPYPLNGYYLELNFEKFGLNIFSKKVNLITAYIVYDRYIHLKKNWYFAYNLTSKIVPNNYRPYFLQRGIGFSPMVLRGYELLVINGMWTGIIKSNLKYKLISRKTVRIPFINSEKFGILFYAVYANLIFDGGYVYNPNKKTINYLNNKFLYGTGAGIDFVTYYDTVIRFEYLINSEKQTHFFISLVAPI